MSQPDATSARAGSNDRLTVVMAGMIAGDPYQGGATWAILQYLLGLRRLGHEVYFVEPVNREALQPDGASLLHSKNATYFRQVMNEFDLTDRSCLLLTGTHRTFGISYEAMESLARRADVLINVAGMLTDELLTEPIPTRVYLDLDPAFIQLWHAVEGIDMHFAGHTHFVTVGLALGQPGALAGCDADRSRCSYYSGKLARVRLGSARRRIVWTEGSFDSSVYEPPDENSAEDRTRTRYSSRRAL
jgi:hypothetical protein